MEAERPKEKKRLLNNRMHREDPSGIALASPGCMCGAGGGWC